MSELDELVLGALEAEEYTGHTRGHDAAPLRYLREEIPLPPDSPPPIPPEAAPLQGGRVTLDEPAEVVVTVREVRSGPVTQTICVACGSKNPVDSRFCGQCGTQLDEVNASSKPGRDLVPFPVRIVSINEDGGDGSSFSLEYADSVLGRSADLSFPADSFLSPKHARLTAEAGAVWVEDLYSLNGTYVKLRGEALLTPGDTFLMGRQVLRFERFEQAIVAKARSTDGTRYLGSPAPGGEYKLLQIGIGGVVQNVFCMHASGAIIGREKGDVIFPRDKFMSGRHAQVFQNAENTYRLVDLNSSNGTWLKIWERRKLDAGDFLFLGQQLFRVEF